VFVGMIVVASAVALLMLRFRQLMLLENVMYPMRRGVKHEKQKRGGEPEARFASAFA